jgi:hypothetical protein
LLSTIGMEGLVNLDDSEIRVNVNLPEVLAPTKKMFQADPDLHHHRGRLHLLPPAKVHPQRHRDPGQDL